MGGGEVKTEFLRPHLGMVKVDGKGEMGFFGRCCGNGDFTLVPLHRFGEADRLFGGIQLLQSHFLELFKKGPARTIVDGHLFGIQFNQ